MRTPQEQQNGETDPLLTNSGQNTVDTHIGEDCNEAEPAASSLSKGGLSVLLLGVFLVNSDSAVQFTLFRSIASDFGQLEEASWIINSYMMGVLVFMPLCGKLSDIFGRMPILAIMYACYTSGALLSGLGVAWWLTLLGRGIAGISNGGIGVLVSILVVDVLPIRDVAQWRSYVYLVNQLGRAVGPPLGGLLADRVDWRWAFLYQVPFHLISLIFVLWTILATSNSASDVTFKASSWTISRFRRIDLLGSITIAAANVLLLLFLDRISTSKAPTIRHDTFAATTLVFWLMLFVLFLLIEGFYAQEPILPLSLYLKRNVVAANLIQLMQTAAQVALYSTIPLYFRILGNGTSLTIAGNLLMITIGVITGGLLSGYLIKRTGQYRALIWISLFVSTAAYLIILLRWRGNASWPEGVYGIGTGFGFGVSTQAAFICLNIGLDPSRVAVATSGFYLSLNTGSIVGTALPSLLITNGVRRTLAKWLAHDPNAPRIIRDVTADLNAIWALPDTMREVVTAAYLRAITSVWLFACVCGGLAMLSSFMIPLGRLEDAEEKKQPSSTYDTFQREERRESEASV